MYDALADYEKALDLYKMAINNGGQKYYVDSQADCSRRLTAYKELSK